MAASSFSSVSLLAFFFFFFSSSSLLTASSAEAAASTTHVVGESSGWTIPNHSSDYSRWASSRTFYVGDVLEFRYDSAEHTVLKVTRSSYRNCNITAPMATFADGMSRITLSTSGSYYFICGVPGHCDAGQKLQLNAVQRRSQAQSLASLPPSLSPSPSPSLSSLSPPPISAGGPTMSPTSSCSSSAPSPFLQILVSSLCVLFLARFFSI